ncbi:MAG: iron-sulfur cluster insertion protein ErpA [Alphaproteobacteria bacterium]
MALPYAFFKDYVKSMSEELRLTESAAKRLVELKAEGKGDYLRVIIDSGGCGGFQYNFKLDSELKEDDLVFEDYGASLIIDPMSLEFVKGSEVDFEEELIGAAFVIKNPNASSSCGCGSSFSI